MRSKPYFSVVLPTYNRAHYLAMAIDSVLAQTFPLFELIIVDDGSTDNTSSVAGNYLADERVQYFKVPNNERAAARNFGSACARGEYTTFLDSDDTYLPWHLHAAYERIARMGPEKLPVFHLAYEVVDPAGRITAIPSLPSPVNEKLLEGNHLSCNAMFIRRDLASDFRFDEDRRLSGSEDYELWLRMACQFPILHFPEVTSRILNHEARSVVSFDSKPLVTRIGLLITKTINNPDFRLNFRSDERKFVAYSQLYLALHLAMSRRRQMAIVELVRATRSSLGICFTYRFIVVIKKILLW